MFGTNFSHTIVRDTIVAFGTMFNNIHIERVNSADSVIQTIKVPLTYAPKQHFIQQLARLTSIDGKPNIRNIFPRMSFEITGFAYDTTRKLQSTRKHSYRNTSDSGDSTLAYSFQRVPYNVNLQLHIAARNMTDSLLIVEQILPNFTPEFSITMNDPTGSLGLKTDVPLVLNGVSSDQQYDGEFEGKELITFTLDFQMKINVIGPVTTSKVITKAIVDFHIDNWEQNALGNAKREERITVEPISLTFNVSGLTGTVSTTTGNKTVTGSGTKFNDQLKIGSSFSVTTGDSVLVVDEILSDTVLKVTIDPTVTVSGQLISRTVGVFSVDEEIFLFVNKVGKPVSDTLENSPSSATIVRQSGANNETLKINNIKGKFEVGDVFKGNASGATGTISDINTNVTIEHFDDSKEFDPETATDID